MTLEELAAGIRSGDEKVRTDTWRKAPELGAAAVAVLAEITADRETEIARAARRALWAVVRHAGRPGAAEEQAAVAVALVPLLDPAHDERLRREALWMLSEIGGEEAVVPVAGLLSDAVLREDARMALERIPGEASLAALQRGLVSADESFRPNVAHSLRVRGIGVADIPDLKLVPVRATAVKE